MNKHGFFAKALSLGLALAVSASLVSIPMVGAEPTATKVLSYDMADLSTAPDGNLDGVAIIDHSGTGYNGVVKGLVNNHPEFGTFKAPKYAGITDNTDPVMNFLPYTDGKGFSNKSNTGIEVDSVDGDGKKIGAYLNDKMSYSAWIYLPIGKEPMHGYSLFSLKGAGGSGGQNGIRVFVNYDNNTRKYSIMIQRHKKDGSSHAEYSTTNPVVEGGVWTHVAGTFDAAEAFATESYTPDVYVDGEKEPMRIQGSSTGYQAELYDVSNEKMVIGNSWNYDRNAYGMLGGIDIYSGLLTQDDVTAVYNAQKAEYPFFRAVELYKNASTTVSNAEKDAVPVLLNKITVDFKAPFSQVATVPNPPTGTNPPTRERTYDKVDVDSIKANVKLQKDTGSGTFEDVSYTGNYDIDTGLYTMNGFGTLEKNTQYRVFIDAANITSTDGKPLGAGKQQIAAFTTANAQDIVLYDAESNEITNADGLETTAVTANVHVNKPETAATAMVALATYQDGAYYKSSIKQNIDVSAQAQDVVTNAVDLPTEGLKGAKVFVWDSLINMMPLQDSLQIMQQPLQPLKYRGSNAADFSGLAVENGLIKSTTRNAWIKFENVDFSRGYSRIVAKVGTPEKTGSNDRYILVFIDPTEFAQGTGAPNGTENARIDLPVEGTDYPRADPEKDNGYNTYKELDTVITGAVGAGHTVYLKFMGDSGICNVDYIQFDNEPLMETGETPAE